MQARCERGVHSVHERVPLGFNVCLHGVKGVHNISRPHAPSTTGKRKPYTGVRVASPNKEVIWVPGYPVVEDDISVDTTTEKGFDGITSIWANVAARHGDLVAVQDPHRENLSQTYRELYEAMCSLASGLRALGLQPGEKVSLFAENSSRWIVVDQGIMMAGGVDAVRGSTAPLDELRFILQHSRSVGLVVQDQEALKKLLPALQEVEAPRLKFIMIMWPSAGMEVPDGLPGPLLTFDQVLAMGQAERARSEFRVHPVSRDDLATLVYTSGTTGHPKGVMLTHGNLMYQVNNFDYFLNVQPGDSTLSLLPPWHIYERSVAYFLFASGACQTYTNIRKFKDDLAAYPPDHFVCVPLVLETLYHKVMTKLKSESRVKAAVVSLFLAVSQAFIKARRLVEGKDIRYAAQAPSLLVVAWAVANLALLQPLHRLATRLVYQKIRTALGIKQTVVSGGGSLAQHLDLFFEVIGLPVLNGWGLTETSPVLACRRARDNVRGTVGLPIPGTQVKVVDPDTFREVADGRQGQILVKGPGVMRGYYDDEGASAKAFIAGDGWLDTGDLGWRAPRGIPRSHLAGHLVLTGRAKDTIVLSNGKNIEPQPIEDAIQASSLIKHVVLLGQDKRELGALVFPDVDNLEAYKVEYAAAHGGDSPPQHVVEDLLFKQVVQYNRSRPDYHFYDHVAHVAVVMAPLSVEEGTLTRTMKPRRPMIMKQYKKQVDQLLQRLRG